MFYLICFVSDDNVLQILPLADEYQMHKLKGDCDNCLLHQVERETKPAEGVAYLNMAQTYNLKRLRESSIELCSKLPLNVLERVPGFNDLDPANQIEVLKVWENLLYFLSLFALQHC